MNHLAYIQYKKEIILYFSVLFFTKETLENPLPFQNQILGVWLWKNSKSENVLTISAPPQQLRGACKWMLAGEIRVEGDKGPPLSEVYIEQSWKKEYWLEEKL